MKTSENCLTHYNRISEDVRFVSNSIIRLTVLKILYEKPSNMKELTGKTELKYSSISAALHSLELKGLIYRKSNRYHIINSLKIQMKNIIQLASIINLLEEIFSIISGHVVDKLPHESILEIHMLNEVKLMESDGLNVDDVINFIEDTLNNADNVRCIMPIYYDGLIDIFNDLVDEGKYVEINASNVIYGMYKEKSKVKYLSSFEGRNNFLLIITNELMILGFFKEGNIFDKNRILVSDSENSLEWANNVFKNFKKSNK